MSRCRAGGSAFRECGRMRLVFWISLLAIGLTSLLGAGTASAGSLVEFPNVSEREPKLVGYLARPDAGLSALAGGDMHEAAVYPAVVVLHGCGGISSHSIDITDRLGSWGYVALASTAWARAASPTPAAAGSASARRLTPMQRCATWRSRSLSTQRGSPCLASRWAVLRCFTRSIST